jgi:hypothetical protein
VKDGAVVPGNVMKVTLSCDHRVVDGATGFCIPPDPEKLAGRAFENVGINNQSKRY